MRLLSVLILTSIPLFSGVAGTITFGSDLSNEWNSIGANIASPLDPSWDTGGSDHFWVTCSGCYNALPVADIPGPPSVVFAETFSTGPGEWSGAVRVWADDAAGVTLDGDILALPNPTQLAHCALPIGCMPGMDLLIPLSINAPGMHTLEFDVYQRVKYTPFGLMYEGSLSTPQVPEPGSLAMMAIGVLLVGLRFIKTLEP